MQIQDQFVMTGRPREVDMQQVENLDAALAAAAGIPAERILHAIDPRRLLSFADGGPPVWSVAAARLGCGDVLFVTYGLSRFIDPDALFDFELSFRLGGLTAGEPLPLWPSFLLRHLARYQLGSRRELALGDPMHFGDPITRAAMAPEHAASMPDTAMHDIGIAPDPELPSVRRVYGLLPDEQRLAELWSTASLLEVIARRDPHLTTRLARRSWVSDNVVRAAAAAGTARDGSATGACVFGGVRWADLPGGGYEIRVPAGEAERLARLMDARLGFGRSLLIHDHDVLPHSEVALVPAADDYVRSHAGRTLELGVSSDSRDRLLWMARSAGPSELVLRFG